MSLAHTQRPERLLSSPLVILRTKISDSSKNKAGGTNGKLSKSTTRATVTSPTTSGGGEESSSLPMVARQRHIILELADASLMTAKEAGPQEVPEFTTLLLKNRVTMLKRERVKLEGTKTELEVALQQQRSVRAQTADAARAQQEQITNVNRLIATYREALQTQEARVEIACRQHQAQVLEARKVIGDKAREHAKETEREVFACAKVDVMARGGRNRSMTMTSISKMQEYVEQSAKEKAENAAIRRAEKKAAEISVVEASQAELSRLQHARETLHKAEEATAKRLQAKRDMVAERQRAEYTQGRMDQFVSKQQAQVDAKKMEREQMLTLEALRATFEEKRETQISLNKSMVARDKLVQSMRDAIAKNDFATVEALKQTLAGGLVQVRKPMMTLMPEPTA